MNYRIILLRSSLFFGLALALAGCTRTPAMPTLPPAKVAVSHPVRKQVTDYGEYTGQTVAVQSVQVKAHVWGYLTKINFKEGDLVEKDQVLFEIDPAPYQALVDQAKADVQAKEATAYKTEAVFKRTEILVRTGANSKEDLDNNRGDWLVAKAQIEVAKANLKTAELNLGYTKVKAEYGGRTSKYRVTLGNMVQSGDQGGGTVLTTIVSVDPMYVEFYVDERTVLQVRELIRQGKALSVRDPKSDVPVYIGLANESGAPHRGRVNFVDNQVDPGTGTMLVRGVFENKPEYLVPGLFVRCRIYVGEPYDGILVSDAAIDSDQGRKIVYVLNDKNEVEVRRVELGSLHDGLRVIQSGLTTEDRVVVVGLQQIRPGAVVDPTDVEMQANPIFAKPKK
jgi:RND family efflux transporter MFP subunit